MVISHGEGPTVLLTAGNHGDEYEGQIALMRLCQELGAEDVAGRMIMLTAANYPAALAGTRTSPIDEGNLNRSFPGDPDGSPTPMIAHYIEHELLPIADYSIDLHSGGTSLMYIPAGLTSRLDENPEMNARQIELLNAFGAPVSCTFAVGSENRRMLSAAARSGVAFLGTELGGGGCTSVETVAVAESGLRRVLKHIGVTPNLTVAEASGGSRRMDVGGADYFVYCPDFGIWEPLVELGDQVEEGQPAANIFSQQTPWRPPAVAHFKRAGTVICKRTFSAVERGDCLFHLATDV